jgi:hypothetical protein
MLTLKLQLRPNQEKRKAFCVLSEIAIGNWQLVIGSLRLAICISFGVVTFNAVKEARKSAYGVWSKLMDINAVH